MAKTWFDGHSDPTADTVLEQPVVPDPILVLHQQIDSSAAACAPTDSNSASLGNEGGTTMGNEGVTPAGYDDGGTPPGNEGGTPVGYSDGGPVGTEGGVPVGSIEGPSASDPASGTRAQPSFRRLRWVDEASAPPTSFPSTSASVSKGDGNLGMPTLINLHESGLRRSPWIAALKSKSPRAALATLFGLGTMLLGCVHDSSLVAFTSAQSAAYRFEQVNANFDGTCNALLYHVFAVGKEANESYTFKEMLRQDDKAQFVAAIQNKIADHEKRGHWELILRSSMPKKAKTIMAGWSFKRKRFPDGSLTKDKARLCAYGGQQQWGG